jgi:4'-phosphopantetheinyl transferase EntD
VNQSPVTLSGPLAALLLPTGTAVAESFGDPPPGTPGTDLFPGEEEAVRNAVDKRRREYGTVRYCARQALAELGLPPTAILSGPKREPLWPDGVVGSMTHCDGYRAAALARTDLLPGLGIDAEPHGPLPDGVLDTIALPEELDHLAGLVAGQPAVHWDRLLFSAKESVYKTWFPLAQCWLGFEEASIKFTPGPAGSIGVEGIEGAEGGTFTARLLRPGLVLDGSPVDQLTGRWLVAKGLVITAIALIAG